LLVAFSSVAAADSWTEVGLVRSRLDMGEGHVVDAYSVRFAPHVVFRDGLYAGVELDGGRIAGDVAVPPAYRSTGAETGPTTAVSGEAYSIGALFGMRVRAGSISGSGEVLAGFHRADLRDSDGLEVAWINPILIAREQRTAPSDRSSLGIGCLPVNNVDTGSCRICTEIYGMLQIWSIYGRHIHAPAARSRQERPGQAALRSARRELPP
jgi:hypothetical protein